MENKVQLITYIDRFSSRHINELHQQLHRDELKPLFGGVHLLPFFYPIDRADAGFDPIDHRKVDPRLGTWDDIKALSRDVDVMADLIVNHVSAESQQFLDYLEKGESSPFADMFLTYRKIFPQGATDQDLLKIYRPRPGFPFSRFQFKDGTERFVWTTFTSNQIDIDVNSEPGKAYLESILDTFQQAGIRMIRLDAAGYAIKLPGTSCFMIDKTFEFIESLTQKARKRGMNVLVEIHSHYKTQISIAEKVDYIYDFALPVLVLDTLFHKSATNLKNWLRMSPRNAFTVLDTHDGIGIVDVASEQGEPGLIDDKDIDHIVRKIHENSGGQSKKATGAAASNLDLYQVNCTYFDALGRDENSYIIARAIQFFSPGIPQIYYMGLFAGTNDMKLLEKTNVGRDINRHYYTKEEVEESLQKPVVKKLRKLIEFRNTHPAFNGEFEIQESEQHELKLRWNKGNEFAQLSVDLNNLQFTINHSSPKGEQNLDLI
ncbi:sucrose phosphorylase [Prolixibacter denitrificans]|uniref:Sucrose phosphorylase n=1 Tax=Prolixibacter denitrificans TaxID=1541063 RepID=A0A2P8CAR4_9BACT|nr:sucrose phosphorylase [Prolixibacter denitrificans]PSK82064.1 sucrose phosphorylase [Prolixibacter denitrificans]GET22656.1 sucrose phosphorylase [Prolixibacter denitrificans]